MCNQRLKGKRMSKQENPPDAEGTSPFAGSQLRNLSDAQVIGLLGDYRTRAPEHAGAFDAAIVELELEAVRRRIPIDGAPEITPPALALQRCRHWIERGRYDAAAHCFWHLAPLGAWQISQEVQSILEQETRLYLMRYMLFVLDTFRLGGAVALMRIDLTEHSDMSADLREAYLRSCITAHFAEWMMCRAAG
jgi:hypothetical protein